jgi:hypothetical protein
MASQTLSKIKDIGGFKSISPNCQSPFDLVNNFQNAYVFHFNTTPHPHPHPFCDLIIGFDQ